MSATLNIQDLNDAGIILIDKDVYRDMKSRLRKDLVQKICTTKEVMYILSLRKDSFYDTINNKNGISKLRPSKLRGKWVLSSVYEEAERLNK